MTPHSRKTSYSAKDLNTLEMYIRATNPEFNPKNRQQFNPEKFKHYWSKVKSALDNVQESVKSRHSRTVNDIFADPLLLINNLIKYAQPDQETILASILYASVRPVGDKGVNEYRLMDIQETLDEGVEKPVDLTGNQETPDEVTEDASAPQRTLGEKVSKLIEDTLYFRALDADIDVNASTEEKKGYIEQFQLMSLWAALDPRAILIRGVQLIINLGREAEHPNSLEPDITKRSIFNARYVYAPLLYIIGYEDLRKQMLNLCFQIESPDEWRETSKIINGSLRVADQENVKSVVATYLEREMGWKEGFHFEIQYRSKSAFSAHDKLERKNQKRVAQGKPELTVEQLGDLHGIRIVLKKNAFSKSKKQDEDLDTENNARKLGEECVKVYGKLSRKFGRGNRQDEHHYINPETKKSEAYSYDYEQFYAELALQDPRDQDEVRLKDKDRAAWEKKKYAGILDAYFDDYISYPKASGFSVISDLLAIPVPGKNKMLRIECQIVDEDRDITNRLGPRTGHFFYKIGERLTDSVVRWRQAAQEMMGHKPRTVPNDVRVFYGQKIINISDDPTLRGFFKTTGMEHCTEANIAYPLQPYNPNATYGLQTELRNGCEIMPVVTG